MATDPNPTTNAQTELADMPTAAIDKWFEGRWLCLSRSCGDCPDGPPCRCSSDADELSPQQQSAVDFYVVAARAAKDEK